LLSISFSSSIVSCTLALHIALAVHFDPLAAFLSTTEGLKAFILYRIEIDETMENISSTAKLL